MIIGIVAISKDFAIGRNGKLPWHYPEDLKFFKRTTIDNTVVMGSRTWKAIGRPLSDRLNIVLSRGSDPMAPGVLRLNNTEQLRELSKYLRGDVYVIGGGRIYESLSSLIDEWVVTEVPIDVPDADTYMPKDFLDGFHMVERIDLPDNLSVRRLRRNA